MANISDSTTDLGAWALCIGINYYPTQGHYLKGCVWDAQATGQYLREMWGEKASIMILTASVPSDSSSPPLEPTESWPTHANIINGFRHILENAIDGDQVYVHFAGHGSQISTSAAAPELALVLLYANTDGSLDTKYLRGTDLGRVLSKMSDKGLKVTLVLDCCFSGAIIRGKLGEDVRIRRLEVDPDATCVESEDLTDLIVAYTTSRPRDGSFDDSWLTKPQGYTVLTACAPNENAYELIIEGQNRGILSHFLLSALQLLTSTGASLTHETLHSTISTSIHASWPQQTPMRYGVSGRSYFGSSLTASDDGTLPVFRKDGGLFFMAGRVHGVSEGDVYRLFPATSKRQLVKLVLANLSSYVSARRGTSILS